MPPNMTRPESAETRSRASSWRVVNFSWKRWTEKSTCSCKWLDQLHLLNYDAEASSRDVNTPKQTHGLKEKQRVWQHYVSWGYKVFNSNKRYLVEARQWLVVVVLTEVEHQSEQTEDLSVETELQEEPVVVFSDTVVDPGNKDYSWRQYH